MTKDDLPEPDGFSVGELFTTKRSTSENFAIGAELPVCEWYSAEQVLAAIAAHDSQAARERDIAEDALLRKGYRKSCDIPACNCGDQWNHGGHANARLYEVSEALMQADCRRNGETILADVVHVCAENERLKAIAAHDAKLDDRLKATLIYAVGEMKHFAILDRCVQRIEAELENIEREVRKG